MEIEGDGLRFGRVYQMYNESHCDDMAIDPMVEPSNGGGESLWGDVAVGKKRSGYLVYEVPSDWKTLEIYYKPEFFKSTRMVFRAKASDMK